MRREKLAPHPVSRPPRGPLVLAIMDGIGRGAGDGGDAVAVATTPHLESLWAEAPTRELRAHGRAVGLPGDGDMGNSEVGHNALGSGQIVRQGAALVGDALDSGALFRGDTWRWIVEGASREGATLHLCGLLSDGNVHAHVDHVISLIAGAVAGGVRRVRVHPLADGRDVADPSFERYLGVLEEALEAHRRAGHDCRVASGGGRMLVTMDRYEADWRIVERGWQAHVLGTAEPFEGWREALAALRERPGGRSDQTLGAFTVVDAGGAPVGAVRDGDSFVFWNFRGDRALEISRAFEQGADFSGFDRLRVPRVRYAGMMQYDGDLGIPARFLVAPPVIEGTMGEYTAALGLRTLAVSETQKFGHVTYFWNGNRSGRIDDDLETYVEVPSDRIAFDLRPEMRAREITDVVLGALAGPEPPQVVRLNYANGDMVGHTGNLPATVQAVQVVDAEVGRLREAVRALGGLLVVTADHGNADDMWMRSRDGTPRRGPEGPIPKTSHTLAPVRLSIDDPRPAPGWSWRDDLPEAGLAHVAATLLELLGRRAPEAMEPSLLRWR